MRVMLMMSAAMLLWSAAAGEGRETAKRGGTSDLETIVSIDGDCLRYEVGPSAYGCSGLVYMHWRSGRTAYMLPTVNGGTLMLSGGSDSQLTPERYILNIDKMTVGLSKGGPVQSYSAKGRCASVISTDGQFVRSLECDAGNGSENVVIRFKGAGTPVTVKHF